MSFCTDYRGLTHRRIIENSIKTKEKVAKNTLLHILPPKYTFYSFFLSLWKIFTQNFPLKQKLLVLVEMPLQQEVLLLLRLRWNPAINATHFILEKNVSWKQVLLINSTLVRKNLNLSQNNFFYTPENRLLSICFFVLILLLLRKYGIIFRYYLSFGIYEFSSS